MNRNSDRGGLVWKSGALFLLLATAGCNGTQTPPEISRSRNNGPLVLEPAAQDNAVRRTRGDGGRCTAQEQGAKAGANPGDFDFYLLTLSWEPEFCHGHPNAAGCGNGKGFIVHGLWPQDNDGTHPACCSNAPGPRDPEALADIMPGVPEEHEWEKHGTCTGLSADAYFGAIRKQFTALSVPEPFTHVASHAGIARDSIAGQFAASNRNYPAESFVPVCQGRYLSAVEICLDKSMHPIACQNVRSTCPPTVQVAPPQ